MKKLFTYSILLVLCGLVFSPVRTLAGSPCDKVSGTGNTTAVGPAAFQGTASVKIDGQVLNASVTTVLLGQPQQTEDGTLQAATSHTFAFSDGSSFTTLDSAILSPTDTPGVYRLNTRAAISGGTGAYANACGSFSIHGTINLITGVVDWRFTGRVCDCG